MPLGYTTSSQTTRMTAQSQQLFGHLNSTNYQHHDDTNCSLPSPTTTNGHVDMSAKVAPNFQLMASSFPFKTNDKKQQQKEHQDPLVPTTVPTTVPNTPLNEQQQQEADEEEPRGIGKFRIGYWWSEKKSQRLNANELSSLFAERDCELIKLDFDKHLEEQGPFDLIVHKVSDILVKADQGDIVAKKTISAFESYVRKHPQTVILDPLDNNRALLDRYKQYRLIEQSGLARENVVFTPPFVHLTSTNIDVNRGRIRRSKITFPIVCKPILAQGSTGAHQMCIIFNEAGLKDVKPPCVAQSFVNHNAKLFKLFVIKDKYYVIERPSLKNFQAGDYETVFFFSHDISKPNSSSSLIELDEADKQNLRDLMSKMQTITINGSGSSISDHMMTTKSEELEERGNIVDLNDGGIYLQDLVDDASVIKNCKIDEDKKQLEDNNNHYNKQAQQQHDNNHIINNMNQTNQQQQYSPLMPSDEKLNKIVKIFSEKLGLTFYGIDIIIENGTSRYAIIDMNTFPGYDGVENFLTIFRDVVCDAIPKETIDHQNKALQTRLNKRKPMEHDSGIEST